MALGAGAGARLTCTNGIYRLAHRVSIMTRIMHSNCIAPVFNAARRPANKLSQLRCES
jgi:hypothetical protein